ncbi:MAG TPA: GNAT family N-acetyltransferase [Desulfomonilia bacterium]
MDTKEETGIVHDEEGGSFSCQINGLECRAEYEMAGDDVIDIFRTFVDPSLRGRGIAEKLMRRVLEYAKDRNLKIRPSCSYAVTFFRRNPQHSDMVAAGTDLANDGSCRLPSEAAGYN